MKQMHILFKKIDEIFNIIYNSPVKAKENRQQLVNKITRLAFTYLIYSKDKEIQKKILHDWQRETENKFVVISKNFSESEVASAYIIAFRDLFDAYFKGIHPLLSTTQQTEITSIINSFSEPHKKYDRIT